MELWDAYNEDGSLAGCELIRGQPIPAGLCHLVCDVLVRHTDGSFLLMRRDFGKEMFPGMYEATAGGSALKGESSESAARRELFEETGVSARELTPIYNVLGANRDTIYHGYLCVTDCDKASVTLQPGETVGYVWLSETEFLHFFDSEDFIPVLRDRLTPFVNNIRHL